jgi:valyl-tRNA synthetase
LIDKDEELKKIEAELKYYEGFLESVNKKLSNEKFVNSAPEAVVKTELKKQADALTKIENLNIQKRELLG